MFSTKPASVNIWRTRPVMEREREREREREIAAAMLQVPGTMRGLCLAMAKLNQNLFPQKPFFNHFSLRCSEQGGVLTATIRQQDLNSDRFVFRCNLLNGRRRKSSEKGENFVQSLETVAMTWEGGGGGLVG